MDIHEARKQQQERSEWTGCDPFTLVAAARQTLYTEIGDSKEPTQLAPLEEVITRFEQQSRATVGSSTVVGSPSA